MDAAAVAEAVLLLQWVRGAGGRFDPGTGGAGVDLAARSAATLRASATPDQNTVPRVARDDVRAGGGRAEGATTSGAGTASEETDPFDALREQALACRRCRLCETRSTVVFGEGSRRPRLLVVGEAPGADEDASGRPFVGKAGQLLTKMLAAIGLSRDDVFIANVLKCRPPGNRPPAPDEVAACRPYLEEQVRLLDPELILVLGNHAAKAVLRTERGISSIRGQVQTTPDGRKVLPTFHPSYLLRTPEAKREAWLDLQTAARLLGLSIPR